MSKYLKDVQVKNICVSVEHIDEIANLFDRLWVELHAASQNDPKLAPVYVFSIRYDGQGVQVYSPIDLLDVYKKARKVERIIFSIQTSESLTSNKNLGRSAELVLDRANPNCFLTVTSDVEDWVESAFSRVVSVIRKMSAWHQGLVRSKVTELVIQLLGVLVIFVISVTAAREYELRYPAKNAFLTVFLFVMLMLANIWTYIGPALTRLLGHAFPNIEFLKPGKEAWHWGVQAVITAVIGGIVLFVLDKAGSLSIATLLGALP